LHHIIEPISKDLRVFDRRLNEYLSSGSPLINAVSRHILSSKGKRLRPTLLLLAARSGGYYTPKLLETAASIELIHTATLLHDDVVDGSSLRRGRNTVNAVWTNLVSVLMGDFLFSRAFRVLIVVESADLIRSISAATERVSFGELRQTEEIGNYGLPEKEYLRIIADKTASLFAICCEAGPILKKASSQKRKQFREFGENVGIAFQITDDLLDCVGVAEKTGKRPGNDLIHGQVTLPLIYSLKRSSQKVRREMVKYLSRGIGERGVSCVLKFVTEQGGIDYAYDVARSYSDRAMDMIDSLRDTVYSRALYEMVRFTVSRDN